MALSFLCLCRQGHGVNNLNTETPANGKGRDMKTKYYGKEAETALGLSPVLELGASARAFGTN